MVSKSSPRTPPRKRHAQRTRPRASRRRPPPERPSIARSRRGVLLGRGGRPVSSARLLRGSSERAEDSARTPWGARRCEGEIHLERDCGATVERRGAAYFSRSSHRTAQSRRRTSRASEGTRGANVGPPDAAIGSSALRPSRLRHRSRRRACSPPRIVHEFSVSDISAPGARQPVRKQWLKW